MIIGHTFEFSAAHHLPWHKGKCKNLHGHTWKVEVQISGDLDENGTVVDFIKLKVWLRDIIDQLDHKNLNDIIDNPTCELIAEYIFQRVRLLIPVNTWYRVERVKVWESDDSFAIMKGE